MNQKTSKPKENLPDDPEELKRLLSETLNKLEELKGEQDKTVKQLDETREKLDEISRQRQGWLITTPNTQYNGSTLTVKFSAGMAFIPETETFPHLSTRQGNKSKPLTATQVAKMLRDDYGYEARFFGNDELEEMQKLVEKRKQEYERAKAEEALSQRSVVGGLERPASFFKGGRNVN